MGNSINFMENSINLVENGMMHLDSKLISDVTNK